MKAKITAAAACLAMAMLCGCGTIIERSTEFAHFSRAEDTSSAAEEIVTTPEEDSIAEETDSEAESIPEEDSSLPDHPETVEEQTEILLEEYPANDGPLDVYEGATENMLGRSLLCHGDDRRLAAKLKQAEDDPEITTKICFLGDSITDGTGASEDSLKYVERCRSWWEDTFISPVEIINSGIGATDSYCGVHRAYQDATGYMADIYVIEFINDDEDELYCKTMDSLIRMCLSQPNNPAVILLEPTRNNRPIPQPQHYKAATFYNVTEISFNNAIMPEIDSGNCEWEDIIDDNVHPNDEGHAIMAQLITDYWQSVLDDIDDIDTEIPPFDPSMPSLMGDLFNNATMGTRSTPGLVEVTDEGDFKGRTGTKTFKEGWSTEEGGKIEFDISFKNLGMLYREDINGGYGTAIVQVDNEPEIKVDARCDGPVSFANGEPIYWSDTEEMHHVTVEVEENEEENDFDILAWLIS